MLESKNTALLDTSILGLHGCHEAESDWVSDKAHVLALKQKGQVLTGTSSSQTVYKNCSALVSEKWDVGSCKAIKKGLNIILCAQQP